MFSIITGWVMVIAFNLFLAFPLILLAHLLINKWIKYVTNGEREGFYLPEKIDNFMDKYEDPCIISTTLSIFSIVACIIMPFILIDNGNVSTYTEGLILILYNTPFIVGMFISSVIWFALLVFVFTLISKYGYSIAISVKKLKEKVTKHTDNEIIHRGDD